MADGAGPILQPLITKLSTNIRLSDEEKAALLTLPVQVAQIEPGQDIVREGDQPTQCCLMLEGMTCSYKFTGEGRRQIMCFYVPGDVPDLQSLYLRKLDSSLATVNPCRVGFIPHTAMRELCLRHPAIMAAFWRETLIDASIFREWVLNVGRRKAYGRMAHVFCEMVVRFRAIGLADGYSCDLPVTQVELADALGLSVVHVNRTLQELRDAGLVNWSGARLVVLDWAGLKDAAGFDPAFLHLRDERAAA